MKFLKSLIIIILVLVLFWVVVNIIPGNKVCEENPWISQDQTMICAHRGGAALNPENTEKAFDYVILETDYTDIVEIDVQFTKDGVLVIHHDKEINRMALEDQENKVYLKDLTLSELEEYNFGRNFIDRLGNSPYQDLSVNEVQNQGLSIMTLEEFLTKYQGARDFKLYLEIKLSDDTALTLVDEVKALLESEQYSWWKDRTMLISSYDPSINYVIDKYENQFVGSLGYKIAAQIVGYVLRLDSLFKLEYHCLQTKMIQKLGPIKVDMATERLIESCHQRNQAVAFYTINERSEMEHLVKIGADAITTDNPDVLFDVLNSLE